MFNISDYTVILCNVTALTVFGLTYYYLNNRNCNNQLNLSDYSDTDSESDSDSEDKQKKNFKIYNLRNRKVKTYLVD